MSFPLTVCGGFLDASRPAVRESLLLADTDGPKLILLVRLLDLKRSGKNLLISGRITIAHAQMIPNVDSRLVHKMAMLL